MPGPSDTLPVLEQRLTGRLLAFELLDKAWPRGPTAIERAGLSIWPFPGQRPRCSTPCPR